MGIAAAWEPAAWARNRLNDSVLDLHLTSTFSPRRRCPRCPPPSALVWCVHCPVREPTQLILQRPLTSTTHSVPCLAYSGHGKCIPPLFSSQCKAGAGHIVASAGWSPWTRSREFPQPAGLVVAGLVVHSAGWVGVVCRGHGPCTSSYLTSSVLALADPAHFPLPNAAIRRVPVIHLYLGH